MTLLLEKRRLIVSPGLVPTQMRREDKFGHPQNVDVDLTIGLINNMPDAALQATERQFMRLLRQAAGDIRIDFHCFSLPSVKRSQTARWRVDEQYTDITEIDRLQIDGLIVTGAEPVAANLAEEAYWRDLTDIVDWAKTNTRSTIWSCLAAHVAVLHLDGIERRRLATKCSGIYDCFGVTNHWLTDDLPSPFKVAHSRLNELHAGALTAKGYQLLTHSPEAGVDIFARRLGSSEFIFFQGHPEYEALSLEREYLRDISRFLAGERDTCPAVPAGYFDTETEEKLASFAKRASTERRPALSTELPDRTLRPDVATNAAATAIFRNWLGYLYDGAQAPLPRTSLSAVKE
jgi:homoserine O-succinyltransferase